MSRFEQAQRGVVVFLVAAVLPYVFDAWALAQPAHLMSWPRMIGDHDQKDELLLRRYFRGCSDLVFESAGRRKVFVNGHQLPFEIEFPTTIQYEDRRGAEANPIRFVLVEPSFQHVDGFRMPVGRPFYIAKTEFSMEHAAGTAIPVTILIPMPKDLVPEGEGGIRGTFDDTYAAFVAQLKEKLGFSGLNDAGQQVLTDHLKDRHKPYLVRNLGQIPPMACTLSSHWGVQVRLPSVGEWYAAMRGGTTEQKFWWGNDWNPPDCWFREPGQDSTSTWRMIRSVHAGVANPHGLLHVIGNVEELVFPTESERRIIYEEVVSQLSAEDLEKGPDELSLVQSKRLAALSLDPNSAIRLGGSVSAMRNRSETDAVDLLHSVVSSQLCGESNLLGAIGVRWVIEIPGGKVTIGE